MLDVIITNTHVHYDRAVVGPPIGPDVKGQGVPSDHRVAIARPVADPGHKTSLARYELRTRRKVTASALNSMRLHLATRDWSDLYNTKDIDLKVDLFNEIMKGVLIDSSTLVREMVCSLQGVRPWLESVPTNE